MPSKPFLWRSFQDRLLRSGVWVPRAVVLWLCCTCSYTPFRHAQTAAL